MKKCINCRACGAATVSVLDLGETPLANCLVDTRAEAQLLPRYPLEMRHCPSCDFVQLGVAIDEEVLYKNYLYETPDSEQLSHHYQALIHLLGNGNLRDRRVIEMGSNTGAFLHAARAAGASVAGIEPAERISAAARASGLEVATDFFGCNSVDRLVSQLGQADLFVARHCLAHLDDLNGVFGAVAQMLKPGGIFVVENAYLMRTLEGVQIDQMYHEHMSYFALKPLAALAQKHGLRLFDHMEASLHGGSVVMLFCHDAAGVDRSSGTTAAIEAEAGLTERLEDFAVLADAALEGLTAAVRGLANRGRRIECYGAAAKGNTLLNAAGFSHEEIAICRDTTVAKQGKFLPGSGIKVEPFVGEAPDVYLLTAWNYAEEILRRLPPTQRVLLPVPHARLARGRATI